MPHLNFNTFGAQKTEITLFRRQAFAHAYGGYKKYAWGHDEIRPVSKSAADDWGRLGATLIDSLDTALIMGFHDDFMEGVKFVEKLSFDSDWDASTFETTIRYLGGLLAAYELSGEKVRHKPHQNFF